MDIWQLHVLPSGVFCEAQRSSELCLEQECLNKSVEKVLHFLGHSSLFKCDHLNLIVADKIVIVTKI